MNANVRHRRDADRLASQALRRDPTSVPAIVALAFSAEIQGNKELARRLFTYSNTLSRRDLRTRLWLIEDAVAQENIPAALEHYDVALRTSRSARALLFPILASAIDVPDVNVQLANTLAKNPPWRLDFVEYAAVNAPPNACLQLFRRLTSAGVAVPSTASQNLLSSLVKASLFEEAWSFYASLRKGVDRTRSRDRNFATEVQFVPFDWEVADGASGISASIQRKGKQGIFDFFAPPSVGGLLLRQLQLLTPGPYVIEGRSVGIDQPPQSRPYWALSCLNGQELGRVTLPPSSHNDGSFTGRFIVPPGCDVQFLSLLARPSTSITGVVGEIDWVVLRSAL
ncbi:hypothetical protein IC614_08655 [Allosphingosinicella flava]|uniref:Tetratricopeptide repeat protein n=1 Tax=Allosphingosinicella flava TaxID=2771430 RepID=A0A7T2LLE3_9SPHN|nr:hypothetical protein [Sphingosinicella flava]QPQ54416.1 hypothetical protein IC614_08655 [Sphingosinicella flava]